MNINSLFFYHMDFDFFKSGTGKLVIVLGILFVAAGVVCHIIIKRQTNPLFTVISTAEVKFVYEQGGLHTAMIEFQTESGMVTVRANLLFLDFKNEILKAFPQKKFVSTTFSFSEKNYTNTKHYQKWAAELPYNFEYPKVTIQYNEKNPHYFKLLSMQPTADVFC